VLIFKFVSPVCIMRLFLFSCEGVKTHYILDDVLELSVIIHVILVKQFHASGEVAPRNEQPGPCQVNVVCGCTVTIKIM